MTRFDDFGTGDGRWDDSLPPEEFLRSDKKCSCGEKSKVDKKTEKNSDMRPVCFGLACWKIREAIDRGETIDIPSLGISIEPKK